MKIIDKNILTVDDGIIFQQVNCQGVMGKGIALQIRNKWPVVYDKYKKYCNQHRFDFELLGDYQSINVANNLFVCNIFGQLNYGYNARFTDYGAIKLAFLKFEKDKMDERWHEDKLYFPEKMGCMNGGGDWNVVSKIIEYYFPDAYICRFNL